MTREEILKLANAREYTLMATSGDRDWLFFTANDCPINLQVWIGKGEFELTHVKGLFTTSSGRCGSFEDDEHFSRFENELAIMIRRLK